MTQIQSRSFVAAIFLALSLLLVGVVAAEDARYAIRTEKSVMIPMRDGTLLSTDLYMPEGLDENLPTILIRTVYSKNNTFGWNPVYKELVERGYVIAIQDIRGRYESEGRYVVADGRREDGTDTVDWLIKQPWSSKKIGTAGCSYLGETQVVLAATRHPNLVAAIPMSAASGFYIAGRAWSSYDGGVFELAQTAGWFAGSGTSVFYGPPEWVDRGEWFRSETAKKFRQEPDIDFDAYLPFLKTLPTSTILQRADLPPTDYDKFVASLPDDDYYRNKDWAKSDDRFNVPAIFMDSWYDYGAAESLEMFRLFRENADSGQ